MQLRGDSLRRRPGRYREDYGPVEIERPIFLHEDVPFDAALSGRCAFPTLPLDHPGPGPSELWLATREADEEKEEEGRDERDEDRVSLRKRLMATFSSPSRHGQAAPSIADREGPSQVRTEAEANTSVDIRSHLMLTVAEQPAASQESDIGQQFGAPEPEHHQRALCVALTRKRPNGIAKRTTPNSRPGSGEGGAENNPDQGVKVEFGLSVYPSSS
jgi:hypothetical protein